MTRLKDTTAGLFWDDTEEVLQRIADEAPRFPPPRTWEAEDYLPNLAEAERFDVSLFQSWDEVAKAAEDKEPLLFDIEVFSNYFLVVFTSYVSGKSFYLEMREGEFFDSYRVKWVVENFLLVGFNSNSYDLPILTLACEGFSCSKLKEASDAMIVTQMKSWQLLRTSKVQLLEANHIDLIEVAPLQGSLKLYAGRLHVPKMQDLPFSPNSRLSENQIKIVRYYCFNDTQNTAYLYRELKPVIGLRIEMSKTYGVDLRSKSDAQIAEAVIGHELTRRNYGVRPNKPDLDNLASSFRYKVPDFISFELPQLQETLRLIADSSFVVGESGYCDLPEALKNYRIAIGGSSYKLGLGGLHSEETAVYHCADSLTKIVDRDVTSYYPSIILNQSLKPQHLGEGFLEVYRSIVEERKLAKKNKDKLRADMLKIVVNGSFGKFGNRYSILYAPDLLIQTTITGQLCLLMLIERLELMGAKVISANTDGVIYKFLREHEERYARVVAKWEKDTQFETEETVYLGVFSRDVNNYVAVKEDLKTKVKGEFSERGSAGDSVLSKNPQNLVCNDAVINFLAKGVPVSQTIRSCKDVKRFVSVRNVTGGAVKIPDYLGKTIRFYYAAGEKGEIVYAKNGHLVPESKGAKPLMTLPPELPPDVDFDRYERIANEMLKSLGIPFGNN